MSHVDRLSSDDLDTMVTSLTGLTMSSSPRLQISIIGGFVDNKNVSASLLLPILGKYKIYEFECPAGPLSTKRSVKSSHTDNGQS